jgi:2,5-furandicarboxylate decarboxylase 1
VFTRVRIPGQDTVDLHALVAADNSAFDAYVSRDHG